MQLQQPHFLNVEEVKGLPSPYPTQIESFSYRCAVKSVNCHGQGRLKEEMTAAPIFEGWKEIT